MKAMLMDNRFKRGLILGGIIGSIVALFASSDRSKVWRKKFKREIEEIYGDLKNKVMDLSSVTKESYDKLVDKAVNEYTERKNIASELSDKIAGELKNRYEELQMLYLYSRIKAKFHAGKMTTKEEFEEIVNDLVDEYAEKKEVALGRVRQIKREFKEKWEELKKEVEKP